MDLSKLRGKVVLLNLWASSCAPCIEELPSLLALQRQMPDLVIVAVSMDQDPDVYHRFLEKHHVNLVTVQGCGPAGECSLWHGADSGDLHHRPSGHFAAKVRECAGLDESGDYGLFGAVVGRVCLLRFRWYHQRYDTA